MKIYSMKLFLLNAYVEILRLVWPIFLVLFALILVVAFANPWLTILWLKISFFILALVCLFLFTAYLYIKRYELGVPILLNYGELRQARMLQVRQVTSNEEENTTAYEYTLALFDNQGSWQEIKFRDNIIQSAYLIVQPNISYPAKQFIRYPREGENFEVLYLNNSKNTILIMNTGRSEFALSVQEGYHNKQIKILENREAKAKRYAELDASDTERQKIYQQAQQDLYDYWQFGTEPKLKERLDGVLYFNETKL